MTRVKVITDCSKYKSILFFKITNPKENHNGFQYINGKYSTRTI